MDGNYSSQDNLEFVFKASLIARQKGLHNGHFHIQCVANTFAFISLAPERWRCNLQGRLDQVSCFRRLTGLAYR